jgi:hypothetical protein
LKIIYHSHFLFSSFLYGNTMCSFIICICNFCMTCFRIFPKKFAFSHNNSPRYTLSLDMALFQASHFVGLILLTGLLNMRLVQSYLISTDKRSSVLYISFSWFICTVIYAVSSVLMCFGSKSCVYFEIVLQCSICFNSAPYLLFLNTITKFLSFQISYDALL